MIKNKKETKVAEEVAPVTVKPSAPESYLVRWVGGEERFDSKSKAEFAASTHKGGYIV